MHYISVRPLNATRRSNPVLRALAGLAAMSSLGLTCAVSAQTVTIGMSSTPNTVDPHFQNSTPNNSVANSLFDRLIERSADGKLVPGLAASWKPVNDTTWEFKLRPGVKFHNGLPFTAQDVKFTIERIPEVLNSPGRYDGYLRAVKSVEVVDPLTLRIHTNAIAPLLPNNLNNVSIVSKEVAEKATTADFNSGKAAIGTGPYKFVRYVPGEKIELSRNDGYWGGMPAWKQVNLRFIPNAGARMASLLSGSVDVIDGVPSNDIARLKSTPDLSVAQVGGFRTVMLMFNWVSSGGGSYVTDEAGKPLAKNPFLDPRVRKAMSIAIDRKGLTDKVMLGTAEPAGQFLPSGTTAYASSLSVPAYDAAGAKRLLAEAGFPNGLSLTLHTPQDRYPNDVIVAQSIAQMWSQVGIRTKVQSVPNVSYNKTTIKQDFSVAISGYGNARGDPSDMLVNSIQTWNDDAGVGSNNHGRYSNPELDKTLDTALATLDDKARERLLVKSVELAINDLAVIPLYNQNWVWATKKTVKYEGRKDGFTIVRAVSPAK
jgi:peptide/nickel transport system substrate-binding protein